MDLGLPQWAETILPNFIGSAFALILWILFLQKEPRERGDLPATGALLAAFVAQFINVVLQFRAITTAGLPDTADGFPDGDPESGTLRASVLIAMLALTLLLHATLRWRGFGQWVAVPVYVWLGCGFTGFAGLDAGRFVSITVALLLLVSVANSSSGTALYSRGFHLAIAIAVGAMAAATLTASPKIRDWILVVFLAGLLWGIWRRQALGLRVERKLVIVMGLAAISVVYLLIVDETAGMISDEGEGLGDPIRFAMLCAAGVLWLPLYAGMARLLTRRAEANMRKARRILAGADRFLDLEERCEYLTRSLGEQFGFRRCFLLLLAPRSILERYSAPSQAGQEDRWGMPTAEPFLSVARERRLELMEDRHAAIPYLQQALRKTGFRCAVPLWQKDEITGFLFLDTGSRSGLEDLRAILPNIAQEMAQSISACALIEEKVRLERTLLRREHLAGLGQLAATVAHEVKNPLSSIRAIAQLMSEDPAVIENHERDIEFISSETARLANTVQQLLVYARPAADRVVTASPVYEVLDTIAHAMQRDQMAREIEVRASVEEPLRRWKAPGEPLREVVLNLVLNALQFSGKGAVVELNASLCEPGRCRIDVVDTGPGIAEADRERIFEPFFTTRERGTGLGLATVRKNVMDLGGSVEVLSPVANGKGSCFRVELPVTALEAVR